MAPISVQSFVCGDWIAPGRAARQVADAVTGDVVALVGHDGLDMGAVHAYARTRGGRGLAAYGFHDRARMLKALAGYLGERKDQLYALSYHTGATRADSTIDIDGGIGTLAVMASKGRRELPDGHVLRDGDVESLSRSGRFLGQHIYAPMQGVAVHINAFNFPVWGMLEKLAPTLLAGMPTIVKPATATCYVAEACLRMIVESEILPEGAVQLIAGGTGDLLDRLDCQDVVSFTGSAETAFRLRSSEHLLRNGVRFVAEQDSLNASILGPDAAPGTPEFNLFVKEVHREMTAKAGQKCTAIRRIMVPEAHVGAVIEAVSARLGATVIGDPRRDDVGMGALVSLGQKQDVLAKAAEIGAEAERVWGDPDRFDILGADGERGAFLPPMLFHARDLDSADAVHRTEAFGPVSTVMGYRDIDHAIALANRGGGSLVMSLITRDGATARRVALGAGGFHGRLYISNRDTMQEATGHGAPMPHMVHGGPGRAGGGEELGGVRAVKHYMQRLAVQGSPEILSEIGGVWVPGAPEEAGPAHPFTRRFGDLSIGETLVTDDREVTMADIEHFASFTGDTFYAHMDQAAAARNPFFQGRVAHGYLLLSFAAGLFVEPNEGPVLANTGLDNLRFLKPVEPGARIHVRLTVKARTRRTGDYGEVRWHVAILDQCGDAVATYELLTMNAY